MKRPVLFQPVYMETPHFQTDLKLMSDHLEASDEILFKFPAVKS